MPLTVDWLLAASARRFPRKVALVAGLESLTYSQLDAEVSRFARVLLALGLQPGTRIGAMLPNSIEMVVVFYAVSRSGAVLVPINPAFTDHELEYVLSDAGVQTVICRSSHTERVHGLRDKTAVRNVLQVDDMGELVRHGGGFSGGVLESPHAIGSHSILYTSGTTGRPKGAQFSHFARVYNSLACQIGYDVHADTRMNCPAPFFHSGAMLLGMINVIAAGGTILVPRDAGPDATRYALEEQGANYLLCVPTIIRRLIDDATFCAAARNRTFNVIHGGHKCPRCSLSK